jgi:small-conductance mechanosensitive channel
MVGTEILSRKLIGAAPVPPPPGPASHRAVRRDQVSVQLQPRLGDHEARLPRDLRHRYQQGENIFKKIGTDLLEDEALGPGFIEPFKSQGVQSMEDTAIIVRGKFIAKPGQQFMIRKEVYLGVQEAFKEAGIKFAHRRVAVDLPPGIEPGTARAEAIEEAAAALTQEEQSPA